ncbi:MAG: hypothetical protein HQ515_08905 [Phycisphaeraceae bacterium]|nr:hypothetical protein [Phycisphaeraceae bacterium]
MTLRLDMLKTATKASDLLGDAASHCTRFLRDQQNFNGGFRGRSEASDLYYTVFGGEALVALNGHTPDSELVRHYLTSFQQGRDLDLVHLVCLGRCWATVLDHDHEPWPDALREGLIAQLGLLACSDRSFTTQANTECGNTYGCFMALGLYQDLSWAVPDPEAMLACLAGLCRGQGAYANETQTRIPSTPATAAAVTILHYLDQPVPDDTRAWLLSQVHAQGGFVAAPEHAAFIGPDLLSTATALHALSLIQTDLSFLRESCLDYLDTLWNPIGGFCGNLMDRTLDCEYTYYGLLALGHLS